MPSRTRALVLFALFIPIPALSQSASEKAPQKIVPSSDYLCEGTGNLAVFGKFIDPRIDKGVWGARVSLTFNGGGRYPVPAVTDKEGRYCIKYPYSERQEITTLLFEHQGLSCVQQISGTESHYINKLLDSTCSGISAHASAIPANVAGFLGFLPKEIIPIQLSIVNTSGSPIQVLSTLLEPQGSGSPETAKSEAAQNELPHLSITPLDAELVSAAVSEKAAGANLLRIGRFALFSIYPSSRDSGGMFFGMALRQNEIISNNISVTKLIFIPRSALPPNAVGGLAHASLKQVGAWNISIRAIRLMSTGEAGSTSGLPSSNLSKAQAISSTDGASSSEVSLVIPIE